MKRICASSMCRKHFDWSITYVKDVFENLDGKN